MGIQIYRDLFFLHSAYRHTADAVDTAQAVLQGVHIVVQFTIGLVHTFHSDEQGGSIAKIIHYLYSQYILGQLRLESGNTVLELAPEFIFVIQLVIELYLNINNAIAAHGESLIFLHFFIAENIIFQGFGYLFHHFLCRVARSYCHYNTLTDCEVWEFILAHIRQTVNSKSNKATHNENYNLAIVHRPFYCVTFLIHYLIFCR